MNVFCATGNLGRDAETKSVGEHSVTSFSIAVRSGFGKSEKTFWLNCNAWNKDKIAPYLTKGSRVGVTGELSIREYDKKDGSKGYSVELRVADIDLPPKSHGAPTSTGGGHCEYGSNQDRANMAVDSVPF